MTLHASWIRNSPAPSNIKARCRTCASSHLPGVGLPPSFGEIKIDFSFVAPGTFIVNDALGWDLLMHHAGSSEC